MTILIRNEAHLALGFSLVLKCNYKERNKKRFSFSRSAFLFKIEWISCWIVEALFDTYIDCKNLNYFLAYFVCFAFKACSTWPLSIIYDTQFQTLKNVLKNLWKHYCFINLKTYVCIKTILWTSNTNCFTIFVHRPFKAVSII